MEWKIKHGKGNLYQVSIPDEDVLLDYMVPISKQSKKVRLIIYNLRNLSIDLCEKIT